MLKTRICLLLFSYLIVVTCYSQLSKIDSLINILPKLKDDTQKANVLNNISFEYITIDFDKSAKFANELINLSNKINYKKGIAKANKILAQLFINAGEYDKAIKHLEFSENYYIETSDSIQLANVYNQFGILNSNKSDFNKAITYFLKALNIYELKKDKQGICVIYNALGIIHSKQNKLDKALFYYNKAIKEFDEIKDNRLKARIYNNIGIVYDSKNNNNLALDYYFKSLKLKEKLNDSIGMSHTYNSIGSIYLEQNENTKALEYLNKSLNTKLKFSDVLGQATTYMNISSVYRNLKLYNKSIECNKIAIELSKKAKSLEYEMYSYSNISVTYKEMNNLAKAYEYLYKYSELKDSLFSDSNYSKIIELQNQYQIEKKEKEIAILTKEKEIQKMNLKQNKIVLYFSISAFILLLLLFFVIYKAYRQKMKDNKLLTEKNREVESQKQELVYQRNQLEFLNSELYQQKEEILSQRDEIEDKSNQLLLINKRLEEFNKNLEYRVSEELQKNLEKDLMISLQSRQAVMGELLGDIAHQWRQPLNYVGIILQNIKEKAEYNELSVNSIIEKTNKAMDLIFYMSQTVDDFQNFLKPEKLKRTFNAKDVIMKTLSFLETPLQNHKIDIKCSFEENIYIYGIANEYAQVLMNILNNAKDVLIERKIEKPCIFINLTKHNEKSVLSIKDNAGGIPHNIIDKIFELYFTTKELSDGTGLGLYMSKTIIEKNMGGKLSVVNIENGADFIIEV